MKTFQELRDYIRECKHSEMETMCYQAGEYSRFQLGQCSGAINVLDDIDQILRNAMKHEDVE